MKYCSLFAGVGGIDFAFEQAGFQCVWANEIDKYACQTYRKNFPENLLVEEDLRKVDAAIIPEYDVLTAGFPCQSFSVCGKQAGFEDERGNLFFEICRVIDATHPKIVFLENVANLVEHDSGKTFIRIHNELASRGYYIRYTVTDACNHGVPQHRTRIYVVAFKDLNECNRMKFPLEIPLTKSIRSTINYEDKAEDELYLPKESKKYRRLNEFIDDVNQVYRFSDYGIQKGKDGVAFTLKANMGSWYDREPIIRDNFGIRKLSPKECFLLQGFPESFKLPDIPDKQLYKQAGNTVCVPVVQQIAAAIKASVINTEEDNIARKADILWWVDYTKNREGIVTIVDIREETMIVDYNGKHIERPISCIGKTLFWSSQLGKDGTLKLSATRKRYQSKYIPF